MLRITYSLIRLIAKVIFGAGVLCILALGFIFLTLPDTDFLTDNSPTVSSYMIAARAENTTTQERVQFVPMSQMPSNIVRAVLVAEDDLFFRHEGFNWKELQDAANDSIKKGRYTRGGSTITQQLARNLFLTKEKTLLRKLREVILTERLESSLSKARILELYLNFAEFGPGVYGIAAASEYHFGKSPRNLSASEASLLAGVLPNPKVFGRKPYPKYTLSRQRKILYRMARYDLHLPPDLFRRPASEVKLASTLEPVEKKPKTPPAPLEVPVVSEKPETIAPPPTPEVVAVPPPDIEANDFPDDDEQGIHIDEW